MIQLTDNRPWIDQATPVERAVLVARLRTWADIIADGGIAAT